MRRCATVRLAWAVLEGELQPVSRYAHLPPAERPPAACPACGGAVTLKLGAQRMHHAAHRSGVRCPLEHGETALHFNAKCALRAALVAAAAPGATLAVRLRCRVPVRDPVAGARRRCGVAHVQPLVRGWDAAVLETALGDTRPDVLLLRAGRPVAALEVLVSHAVSDAKARTLAALGVPWAEVRVTRAGDWEGGLGAWEAGEPLEAWRAHAPRAARPAAAVREAPSPAAIPWRCAAHTRAAAAASVRAANGWRPWLARVVDLYDADGAHARDVVYMEAELRGGRVVAVRLQHDLGDDVIAKAVRPDRARTARELHAAFLRWCAARRAAGTRVDSPMPWVPARRLLREAAHGRAAPAWSAHAVRFPRRWRWDRASGGWRAIEAGARAARWAAE